MHNHRDQTGQFARASGPAAKARAYLARQAEARTAKEQIEDWLASQRSSPFPPLPTQAMGDAARQAQAAEARKESHHHRMAGAEYIKSRMASHLLPPTPLPGKKAQR
jgi:crotonobetainyl-CoA:carnitine CoA-transferase CaiB-like acyl-CoA transferase